jgi:hypothetical protein
MFCLDNFLQEKCFKGNATVSYKSQIGRWRQIFTLSTVEVCDFSKKVGNLPPGKMLFDIVKTHVPTVITECPVLKGLYELKLNINSENLLDPKFCFWGNFYPPSGFYKFKLNLWTTEDMPGGWIEWTAEVKPKRGEMSAAEW